MQEIKSSFHNVQTLVSMRVKKEPGLVLDAEERAHCSSKDLQLSVQLNLIYRKVAVTFLLNGLDL